MNVGKRRRSCISVSSRDSLDVFSHSLPRLLDDDDCNSPVILSDPGGACECECKRERKRQCLRGCEAGGGGGWCLTLSGAEILSMTYELASFPSFFGFGFAQASSDIGFVIIIIGIKHTEAKCRCSKSFNLHFWRQFWLISGSFKKSFHPTLWYIESCPNLEANWRLRTIGSAIERACFTVIFPSMVPNYRSFKLSITSPMIRY